MDIQKIEIGQQALAFASEHIDLAALDHLYAPGTDARDAYDAAMARGFRPGTYMFDQFFSWSLDMMSSAAH